MEADTANDCLDGGMDGGGPAEPSDCGCPLEAIYHHRTDPYELAHFPPIERSDQHTVLYELPYQPDADKPPTPYAGPRPPLPCGVTLRLPMMARCMMRNADGSHAVESRWTVVCRALAKPIGSSRELADAIVQYNPEYRAGGQFGALHRLFEEQCDEAERAAFFGETLPRIVRLALRLVELFRTPVPLLLQWHNHAVSMTQEQAACLLANAFLCTFPAPRSGMEKSFPGTNFAPLFAGTSQSVVEKIKCLCHYFRRVCCPGGMPTGVLTYERRCLGKPAVPDWTAVDATFSAERAPLHVAADGTIEDQGTGLLQMVFANRFLGGGVIGHGCVQEEIRCVINPELLVGRLLFESLRETEAYFVLGTEQYCAYANYASAFAFDADHRDGTPRDASGRRRCYIVGLDALRVQPSVNQYEERAVRRELAKAYVGFSYVPEGQRPLPGIATGNWGCGAFGGHAPLKALLQLMVACVVGRPLLYFTCNEDGLQERLVRMYRFLTVRKVSVPRLFRLLVRYGARPRSGPAAGANEPDDLYDYLYQRLEPSGAADSGPGAPPTNPL
ncbi:poly(ADP-ribose) glycohydrolase [Anopheles gambiae]|uniref:poly(ADP-ribose) glycohydrolase n=1 Tax=Anopheles gambiae TaxID=7165 RepID=UPI002AC9D7AA|nr:poly(ADP-ribose) glycohydrolase [Anopheles gambiae]XP_061500848.1 poly(ADP-ribose) glycohydrolase [Anopheles gambiae]